MNQYWNTQDECSEIRREMKAIRQELALAQSALNEIRLILAMSFQEVVSNG